MFSKKLGKLFLIGVVWGAVSLFLMENSSWHQFLRLPLILNYFIFFTIFLPEMLTIFSLQFIFRFIYPADPFFFDRIPTSLIAFTSITLAVILVVILEKVYSLLRLDLIIK